MEEAAPSSVNQVFAVRFIQLFHVHVLRIPTAFVYISSFRVIDRTMIRLHTREDKSIWEFFRNSLSDPDMNKSDFLNFGWLHKLS